MYFSQLYGMKDSTKSRLRAEHMSVRPGLQSPVWIETCTNSPILTSFATCRVADHLQTCQAAAAELGSLDPKSIGVIAGMAP